LKQKGTKQRAKGKEKKRKNQNATLAFPHQYDLLLQLFKERDHRISAFFLFSSRYLVLGVND